MVKIKRKYIKMTNGTFSIADIASMRFGYGVDIVRPNPKTKADLLDHIANPDRIPQAVFNRPSVAERVAMQKRIQKDIPPNATAKQKQGAGRRGRSYINNQLRIDAHARIVAAVESRTPFFERLVFFWADHFSVSSKNPHVATVALDYENTAIRPHVDGTFRDMLHAVIAHPAMLMFLDNHVSVGYNSQYIRFRKKKGQPLGKLKGLNENLGRELLELHTLGVNGGYSQQDVTNVGQLLAGWTVHMQKKTFVFRPEYAEPATTVILGKTYGGEKPSKSHMEKFLDDLAVHPSTIQFVCTKLARHFISDTPPRDVVNALVDTFMNTGGHLPSVYKTLLDSPQAWQTFGQKTKRPFDHIVSGIKALGMPTEQLMYQMDQEKNTVRYNRYTVGAMPALNQILFHVPGPNGWPDHSHAWVTPQGMTFRLKWAMRMARLATSKKGYIYKNNKRLKQAFSACLGENPHNFTNVLVTNAPTRRESLILALTSPNFIRR